MRRGRSGTELHNLETLANHINDSNEIPRTPGASTPPNYEDIFESPPITITGYRLLVTAILVLLGITKACFSYEGKNIAPTTLDFILCVLGTLTLYWIGPFEAMEPKVLPWFFHRDLSLVFRKKFRAWWQQTRPEPDILLDAHHDEETLSVDTTPRLAVTWHRLISTLTILAFGTAKAVLGYKGDTVACTTLDWVLGVLLTVILYWVGLLEWSRPGVAPEYFHLDLLTGDDTIIKLDPAEYVDHEQNVLLHEFPKYPVKITGYRILNTTVILGFGMTKSVLSYWGRSAAAPITLEWVLGVVAALILYWTGFYEAPRMNKYTTFFQKDYSDIVNLTSVVTALGGLVFFGFIAGINLYVFTVFVKLIITPTSQDNRVDVACRITLLIWLVLSGATSLFSFVRALYHGRFSLASLGAWCMAYFLMIYILFAIKAIGGHVGSPSDKGSGWTFCLSIPFFTYCW